MYIIIITDNLFLTFGLFSMSQCTLLSPVETAGLVASPKTHW